MSVVSQSTAAARSTEAFSITKESSAEVISGVPVKELFGNKFQYKSLFMTDDGKVDIGVFDMTLEEEANGTFRYEGVPISEFMFFLEGRMTLTDDNGKVTTAGPGEVLFLPKGWVGTRVTSSIRKVAIRFLEEAPQE